MRYAPSAQGPHSLTIRDLRERFGDPEESLAQCSCGWMGEAHAGYAGVRAARLDAARHLAEHRPPDPRHA